MAVSGPPLGITGGHCDDNSLNHAFEQRADGVADGPWAVRAMVRRNVKYGVDLIKFCATGGVFSKGTQLGARQYTLEEMQAIVDEAHTHGRKVAAHAHGKEGMDRAIRAGIDSIEHGTYMSTETLQLMKERGTWFVPTHVTIVDLVEERFNYVLRLRGRHMVPQLEKVMREAHELGIKFATGADNGDFGVAGLVGLG